MMTCDDNRKLDRREFLKKSTVAAAAFAAGFGVRPAYAARKKTSATRKKVIVIGIDGMDPRLSEGMMKAGRLPNFAKLAEKGGYHTLGTSIPPQTPVAWSNFINGSGPASHGIFDFIHRNPEKQCAPFFAMAETVAGVGYWEVGDHKIQLDFWPFNHKPPATLLRRQGVPFWDYLDQAGIYSTFYDLPCNYPPSPSKYGYHRCLSGMGTTDLLGGYGTYQHFAEDGPFRTKDEGGGKRSMLFFEDETAGARLVGPLNTLLIKPQPATVDFVVHRDKQAQAAVIEIQEQRIVLKQGQWSDWIKLDFELTMPTSTSAEYVVFICRRLHRTSDCMQVPLIATRPSRTFRLPNPRSSLRTFRADWDCSTLPDFRKTIRHCQTKCSLMPNTLFRPIMCFRSGSTCWNMPWKTMMMVCYSFTFPAPICRRICSGGTRMKNTRPGPQKMLKSISTKSISFMRKWIRSWAIF